MFNYTSSFRGDAGQSIPEIATQSVKNKTQTSTALCTSALTADDIANMALWKTYTNSKFGFSFKYPENWTVLDDKDNYIRFVDDDDKAVFEMKSGDSSYNEDGLKGTSTKTVQVACVTATRKALETIEPTTNNDNFIHTTFTKGNTYYQVNINYKYQGASLSSDLVEAYDTLLRSIEFR